MKKKLIAMLLSAAMCLSLAACGQKADTPDTTDPAEPSGDAATYTVGICQLVQHEALDAATQGFIDALNEALPGQVKIEEKNASGDSNSCATIVNGFVSEGVDLIMANATAALQAAASATSDIPVLGTSITAYGVALDIDDFSGTVGGNVSGTSDLADLSKQADMITEWFPETQKVGLLFCSAEPNSRYQIEEVAKNLSAKGIETKEFAFTDTNDVSSVTQAACDWADVIYVPTDNTAASNTEAIANVTVPAKTPVIAGEEGICKGCGVATLSISYYDLGMTTGKMAAKILTGEADISTMPIEFTTEVQRLHVRDARHHSAGGLHRHRGVSGISPMGEGRRPSPITKCLEEKNDEFPDVSAQRAARRSRPGPDLGHHGDRRIHHLPHP